jgi:hypothetical protein
VIAVDLGNDERDRGFHAVAARVADDDVAGGGEGRLDVLGGRGIEGGKQNLRRAPGRAAVDLHVEDVGRRRRLEAPLHRLAVAAALGSFARGQPRRLEPGVTGQETNELLADHAGRAENADFELPSTEIRCAHRPIHFR